MLAVVYACALVGLEGQIVEVQVDYNPKAGIPSFTIVGLPDSAVRESRERVRSAIKNTSFATRHRFRSRGVDDSSDASAMSISQNLYRKEERHSSLRFPNKGYVVNLSPADLPKHGPAYDLAIAIGVLAATDQVPMTALDRTLFIGELSLDGRINHVNGVMPMTYAAVQNGIQAVHVPAMDAPQASLIEEATVYPTETLGQLVEHLYDLNPIEPFHSDGNRLNQDEDWPADLVDFADVKGQAFLQP